MINEKEHIQISKFLSMVLRHKPQKIGIELDENGWTSVDTLLAQLNKHGLIIDRAVLNYIVENNGKKRYAFNEPGDKIRANQGHSVDIDLGYTAQRPPTVLYHGTGSKSVDSILKSGLEKRNRHHVHLSKDLETAISVGQRHGKPFVFEVMSGLMYADKFKFYLSENGVWLTDHVPVKYLRART